MTDHEEILYWQQGTDGFFLYLNGLRPVSIHMGFMPVHVLLFCIKKGTRVSFC